MKRLRRMNRRMITLLAAAAVGTVGALIAASPASAHTAGIQPVTYCDGEQAKVKFTITSALHRDSDHVKIVEVTGTFTAAQLGIDTSHYYPVTQTNALTTVLETNAVDVGAGQSFSIQVKLEWYKLWHGTYSPRKGLYPVASGEGTGTDCHVPEEPKASFVDTCDTITVTFQSELLTSFALEDKDGKKTTSDDGLTEWTIEVSADKAPLTAYADGQQIDSHRYTKPEFCGTPSGSTESTCDGLVVTLTNPADGTKEEVSVTFTPNTGDAVTLTAGRGETKTHTFPGTEGLEVSFTSLIGEPETVVWEPDAVKCAPETTAPPSTSTPPDLPTTGSSLTGVIAAGGALIVGGIGVLLTLFLMRRRRAAAGS